MGRALFVDERRDLGIGGDDIREDRDELVPKAHHPPVAHIEIDAAHEFAVGAGGHDDRVADLHRFGQGVMGMAREDHVDAGDDAGHLLVHVKAVVREADHQLGAFGADLVDHLLHMFVADAERVFGEHPAGVGNRHIGESLPDHRDFDAAASRRTS